MRLTRRKANTVSTAPISHENTLIMRSLLYSSLALTVATITCAITVRAYARVETMLTKKCL